MTGTRRRGSAPRARGTPDQCRVGAVPQRFSPACAGNTRRPPRWPRCPAVQPRVRGEHLPTSRSSSTGAGSAPRARGTHADIPDVAVPDRFSPACAGNTPARQPPAPESSVQPRVRGEHPVSQENAGAAFGSAPRARGTPTATVTGEAINRFSPACAGNTKSGPGPWCSSAVQPRVRGEHTGSTRWTQTDLGSAPRARGTLFLEVIEHPRLSGSQSSYR